MKNGELTLIAFADFSKAFDTVDYSIFIRKLHAIGLSKAALLWFLSYLTNRRTVCTSQWQTVNLYGNDIHNCLQDGPSAFISLTTQQCCITPLPNETSMSVKTRWKKPSAASSRGQLTVTCYWMRPKPRPSRCLKCIILTDTLHISPWKIRQLIG